MNRSADGLASEDISKMSLFDLSSEIEEISMLLKSYLNMVPDALVEVMVDDRESVFKFLERVHALTVAQEMQVTRFDGVRRRMMKLAKEEKPGAAGETV